MTIAIAVFAFVAFGGLNLVLGIVFGAWLVKREYDRAEFERLDGIRRMARTVMGRTTGYPVLDTHDMAETMEDYPGSVN